MAKASANRPLKSKSRRATKHADATGIQRQSISFSSAALLAVVPSVLVFQELRFEGFEAEKVGIIAILAAVILGANLYRIIQNRGHEHFQLRQFIRNPLWLAVSALFLISFLSTVFSLSFTRSLLGSPSRTDGLLTLILYLIVFWQASRLTDDEQRAILPFLLLTAIPVCLWALWRGAAGADRPGSTTGNPNYLSSWLVMVLLFCTPQVFKRIADWKRPWTIGQWVTLVVCVIPLLLAVGTLLITSSRAALLGLGAALVFGAILILALTKRRRLLLGLGGTVLITTLAYFLISLTVGPRLAAEGGARGLSRLFVIYDQNRINTWAGAVKVLTLEAEPLEAAGGKPDIWVSLRPVIGYGLETIEQTQSRFGEVMGSSVFIDSFHNLIFDSLVTTGWLGLAACIAVYEAVLYLGLRWLDLIHAGDWWKLLIVQGIGAFVGVALTLALATPVATAANTLMPVGAALGGVGGTVLWISLNAILPRNTAQVVMTSQVIVVVTILGIAVAQWVDNQFGFVQAATQPLWWILLGLLVRNVAKPRDSGLVETAVSNSEGKAWYAGTAVVGLLVLHGFGITIQSRFVNHETGSSQLPIFLAILLVTGVLGASFSAYRDQIRIDLKRVAGIVILWLLFFSLKRALSTIAANNLDNVFSASAPDPYALGAALQLLSFAGVIAVLLAMPSICLFLGTGDLHISNWLHVGFIGIAFVLGSAFYSWNYTGAVLHSTGNGLAALRQPAPLAAANLAFETATRFTAYDSRLRLHWVNALVTMQNLEPDPRAQNQIRSRLDEQIATILQFEPFFINTQEWNVLRQQYPQLRSEVIR